MLAIRGYSTGVYPQPLSSKAVACPTNWPIQAAKTDRFVRLGSGQSPAQLRTDHAFTRSKLFPTLLTEDTMAQTAITMAYINREENPQSVISYEIERQKLLKLSPDELVRDVLPQMIALPPGKTYQDMLPEFQKRLADPNEFYEDQFADHMRGILHRWYLNNPMGQLLLIRYPKGNIVGMEGIRQLQKTHADQLEDEDYRPLDPKCAMLTGHYILPNHRNIGLAPAIKKTLITYGRDHMGYKYFFTPEDKGSSSQHIDTQLGYKPVTEATRFPDIPALAPGQLPSLLKTYNVGKRQLSYLDATTPEARRALA